MDVDYYELGQVYSVQAATEDNESIKTQLLRNAEVNWMKATQVPAIDPVRRDEILREITSLMTEDKNGTVLELTTESATAVPVPGATADTVGHEVEQSELEALGDTRVSLE